MKKRHLFFFGILALGVTTGIPQLARADWLHASAISRCELPDKSEGNLFQFIKDNKLYSKCCPDGQYPTGETDPTKATCAVPDRLNKRGCDALNNENMLFCLKAPPFAVCCPDGSVPTCDPVTKPQCQKVAVPDPVKDGDTFTDSSTPSEDASATSTEGESSDVSVASDPYAELNVVEQLQFRAAVDLLSEESPEQLQGLIDTGSVDVLSSSFVSFNAGGSRPVPGKGGRIDPICLSLVLNLGSVGAGDAAAAYNFVAQLACCIADTKSYPALVTALCRLLFTTNSHAVNACNVAANASIQMHCSFDRTGFGRFIGMQQPTPIGGGKPLPGKPPRIK